MVAQFFKHFPCGRWHLLMGSSFESNLPQQFGRPGSRVESVDLDGIHSPHFAISLWDLEISWSFYTIRIHFQVAIHSRERFVLSSLVLHLLYIVDLPWLTTLETCICSLAWRGNYLWGVPGGSWHLVKGGDSRGNILRFWAGSFFQTLSDPYIQSHFYMSHDDSLLGWFHRPNRCKHVPSSHW